MTTSRIDKVLSQYHLGNLHGVKPDMTAPERRSFVISTLQASDPTPTGKYAGWLMRLWANGTLRIEDMGESARETLVDFERVKAMGDKGLPEVDRSILRYKTMGSLFEALQPFAQVESEGSNERKRLDRVKADIETHTFSYPSGLKVIIPLTRFAAQFHGRGTKWCTSADHDNMFEGYAVNRPIVIFELPNGSRFQGAMFNADFAEEFSCSFDTNDLENEFEFKNIYDNDLSAPEIASCLPFKDDIMQTLVMALSDQDRCDILESGIDSAFFDLDRVDDRDSGINNDGHDDVESVANASDLTEAEASAKIMKSHATDNGLRDLVIRGEPDHLKLSDAIASGDVEDIKRRLALLENDDKSGAHTAIRAHLAYARGDMSDGVAQAIIENAPDEMVKKFIIGYGVDNFITDKAPYKKVQPALFKIACAVKNKGRQRPERFTALILADTVGGFERDVAKSIVAIKRRLEAISDLNKIASDNGIATLNLDGYFNNQFDNVVSSLFHARNDELKRLLMLDLNESDAKTAAKFLCDIAAGANVSEQGSVEVFGQSLSKASISKIMEYGIIDKPQAMRNLIKADSKFDIRNYDKHPDMRWLYRKCVELYAPSDVNKLSRSALLNLGYFGMFRSGLHSDRSKFSRSVAQMSVILASSFPDKMRLAHLSSCIPLYNASDAAAFIQASKPIRGKKEERERQHEKNMLIVRQRIHLAIEDSGLTSGPNAISEKCIRDGMRMLGIYTRREDTRSTARICVDIAP